MKLLIEQQVEYNYILAPTNLLALSAKRVRNANLILFDVNSLEDSADNVIDYKVLGGVIILVN